MSLLLFIVPNQSLAISLSRISLRPRLSQLRIFAGLSVGFLQDRIERPAPSRSWYGLSAKSAPRPGRPDRRRQRPIPGRKRTVRFRFISLSKQTLSGKIKTPKKHDQFQYSSLGSRGTFRRKKVQSFAGNENPNGKNIIGIEAASAEAFVPLHAKVSSIPDVMSRSQMASAVSAMLVHMVSQVVAATSL